MFENNGVYATGYGEWFSAYKYVSADDVIEMIRGTPLADGIREISMDDDADVGMKAFGYETDDFDSFCSWFNSGFYVGELRIEWKNGCTLRVDSTKREVYFWSPEKDLDLETFFSGAKV